MSKSLSVDGCREGGSVHLGGVADLRVVDMHGGAGPPGKREGVVLLILTHR